MKKNPVEKIRDDLFVRKNKDGTYDTVYPLKIDPSKGLFEKGNLNKKHLKIFLKKEFIEVVSYLIPFLALYLILVPGAQEIKDKCQDNIEYLVENSCAICNQGNLNGYQDILANVSLNPVNTQNKDGGNSK